MILLSRHTGFSQRAICGFRDNEEPPLKPQSHMHQTNHNRHFYQRPYDRGKRRPGIEAEHGHRHGDGQFEIVTRCGESQRGGLGLIRANFAPHIKTHEKHHNEIDHQRDSDSHNIEREPDY